MDKEYFVFRTDGDGKQYLIPEKDADLFEVLLEEAFDTGNYRIFSERFNNFKIGYLFHYKFQNPVLMTEKMRKYDKCQIDVYDYYDLFKIRRS